MRRSTRPLPVLLIGLISLPFLVPGAARADAILAPGVDPALDAHMRAHTRMFTAFHAYPTGVGLTAGYRDADALQLIRDFLDQDESDDVQAVTGKHPYELISGYEGPSGVGLRGGGAAIGTGLRYMALKATGAPEEELASARADLVRLIEHLHVIHVITGSPHGIARGAMLTRAEHADEPPIPHGVPELTPLFDDEGDPLPAEKDNGTNRPDNSDGVLPEGLWYWVDSCSKDQLVGWVAAMATAYDAAVGDPDIDQALVAQLQEDARDIGAGFRAMIPFKAMDGQTYDYDLVFMDADGRPSQHHDLNPLSIEKVYQPPDSEVCNVFNLIMALGIIKGLYHVSGDPEAEAFLYEELMGARGYLDKIPPDAAGKPINYLYVGTNTNFSNVNMIAIALFLNVWFERDPTVLARLNAFVEDEWWDAEGVPQSARWLKQPYFHAFYEAMTTAGSSDTRTAEVSALLKAFALDPYVGEDRINCDEDELAAGTCLAIDGVTELTLASMSSWGDHPVAAEALDPAIRPPSNFDARSNPFQVNGGGGSGLMPGGDLYAAYWLLRYLPKRAAGEEIHSPQARDHVWIGEPPVEPEPSPEPVTEQVTEVVEGTPDTEAETIMAEPVDEGGGGGDGGCAVAGGPGRAGWAVWMLLLTASLSLSRLRRRRAGQT